MKDKTIYICFHKDITGRQMKLNKRAIRRLQREVKRQKAKED